MAIGRKWKEVIDTTDKISYGFHVRFNLSSWVLYTRMPPFLNVLIVSAYYRMIREEKVEHQEVDTKCEARAYDVIESCYWLSSQT